MKTCLVQTFLAVAANRSISQAAGQLYVVQSTVSMRIRQLEQELGMELIERGQGMRGVTLTPRGQAFVPIAERWIQLNSEIERFALREESYPLSIASPDSLNAYLLTPLYKQLLSGTPSIQLRISTHQSPEIFSLCDNKEADIGFVFHQSRYSSIVSQPIIWEETYLVCSKDSNIESELVHPQQLDPRFEISLNWSPEIQRWHDYWWNPSITPYAVVDTAGLILSFLDNPRCWALCPKSVAEGFRKTGLVKVIRLEESPPERICYMLMRRQTGRSTAPELEYFKRQLSEYIASTFGKKCQIN